MKLNENGDFCLLYIEPVDEKESVFEAIGAQSKPVVLMPLTTPGQSRPRLFQRPEDFNDLKHLRRQTGNAVIFLTGGSEHLAQLAARSGFPAYPSVDAFADFLLHRRRSSLVDETSEPGEPRAPYRARTGPLPPLAGQRRAFSTGPLSASSWPAPAALAIEQSDETDATTAPLAELTEHDPWFLADQSSNGHTRPRGPSTPIPPARELTDASAFFQNEAPQRRQTRPIRARASSRPDWELEEQVSDEYPVGSQAHAQAGRYTYEPQAYPERPRSSPDLPAYTPHSAPARRHHSLVPVFVLLSALILGGAGLGSFLVISHAAPVTPPPVVRTVGSITFLSSEQLNETSNQGIDDQVQITLHNLGQPASGKSYYAWLLGDADLAESQSILLGKLNVANGNVSLFYPGDAEHTNLLAIGSRFLITEESSAITPLLPSPEISAWRYYGVIPTAPDPNDKHHYAFINHLRHLLADEPVLDELELPGGLNTWFERNTQKLVELTTSARDQWQATSTPNVAAVRGVSMNVLSYLDGMSFLPTDVPAISQHTQVSLDTHLASLGLLNVRGLNQNPPSYIDQIIYHINGLLHAPGSPANARATAARLLPAMSSVITWLQHLRNDAKQLLAMTNAQLSQPAAFTLLNDMVVQASNAYTGNTDPATGQVQQGVAWIHQQLQSLATIAINTYTANGTAPEMGPGSQNAPTLAPEAQDERRPS